MVVVIGSENQNPNAGMILGDTASGNHAVHDGHLEVHQYQVNWACGQKLQGLQTVASRAHHLYLRVRLQYPPETLADYGLVVTDQNSNHLASSG